jgi:AraC-like DNA-binding protein
LDREKLLHYYDLSRNSNIPEESAAIACHEVPAGILGALGRLLALDDEPQLAPVLSPLIEDETHARLLHSEIGGMLARLVWNGNKSAQITKVIKMLNDDLSNNPSIPELAKEAGMSRSALHLHFKSITGMSPLAYTKELRLLRAQTIVRDSLRPIAMIGYDVGYNNPAQFSRDYSRKFHVSPRQDRKSFRKM